MKHLITFSSCLLALLCLTSVASAQKKTGSSSGGLENQGNIILNADRLVPLFSYSRDKLGEFVQGNTSTTFTSSRTTFSLLFGGSQTGTDDTIGSILFANLIYNTPRFGFDYTVIPNLTIGGNLFLARSSGTDKAETNSGGVTNTTEVDAPPVWVFGVAPRIGYVLPLGGVLSLWGRLGATYARLSSTSTRQEGPPGNQVNIERTFSASTIGLNLEPMMVISPVEHFGITVGGNVDFPLTGTAKTEVKQGGVTTTTEVDMSNLQLGLKLGLVGWF